MTIKQYTRNIRASTTLALWVCIIVAVGLFIASFLVPPMGVIDGSVLRAASLLFAFGALATVREAVREGLGAKLTHGNTVLEIRDKNGHQKPSPAPEQEPVEKEEEETE